MNAVIKSMAVSNFKGIRERTINFDSKLDRIDGQNGSGKTTLFVAYLWLFANIDENLKSNPPVFPINSADDVIPTVTINMEIDGKPVSICKMQKKKVTISGDTTKVALTNSYMVNSVPMAERDVIAKLSEYGFDISKFAMLVHPSAFLSQKKDDMRKVLFEMAKSLTDLEIAQGMDGVDELTKLLENYTADEVKAMQNASLKKITEVYGKSGELLGAKIDALESAKVDYDFSALEMQKNMLKEKLTDIDKKRKDNVAIQAKVDSLREQAMKIQFEMSDMTNSADSKTKEKRAELSANLNKIVAEINESNNSIRYWENRISVMDKSLTTEKSSIEHYTRLIEETHKRLENPEVTEMCPTCGQRFPQERIDKVMNNYISECRKQIDKYQVEIEESKKLIKDSELAKNDAKKQLSATKELQLGQIDRRDAASEELDNFQSISIKDLPEYKEKEIKLSEIEKQIQDLQTSLEADVEYIESGIKAELEQVIYKLAQADRNAELDQKIEDIQAQKLVFEQDRANCEKVLYQLDMIQKRKNELLTSEINKHFSLVSWKFFDYLKNGSYTEVCVPMVDGKDLNSALNTAMQIRAKIDICNSLQNFYGQHFPIWIDGAECLDSTSKESVKADTQMIMLSVTD